MMPPAYNPKPVIGALEREDYQSVLQMALPYAVAGNSTAQVTVAFLYESGLGVERDVLEAERWLIKAAAQDDPVAWNNLGTMYAMKHSELEHRSAKHLNATGRPRNWDSILLSHIPLPDLNSRRQLVTQFPNAILRL
jgi:TPR repeat protein